MKKLYQAPVSENVKLDPLMVSFGIDPASVFSAEDGNNFDE